MMPPEGHYTLKTLAKEIENVFSGIGLRLQTQINQPVGQMVIDNPDNKIIVLGRDLSELLGISKLNFRTLIKRLRSPSTYFIHCDLVSSCNNVPSKTESPYSPLQNPCHISVIFSTHHSIRLFQSFPPQKSVFPPKKTSQKQSQLHCSSTPIFCLFLLSQKF